MSPVIRNITVDCLDTGRVHYFKIEDFNDYSDQLDVQTEWEIYDYFHTIIKEEAKRHGITFWDARDGEGETWSSEM